MSEQNNRWSVKCRVCRKRFCDMYTSRTGYCPKCGARHIIHVTTKEQLENEFNKARELLEGGEKQ